MRQLIAIAIALIVMGTAWMFYLQYAENKFQADLPKASAPTSEPDTQNIEATEAEIEQEILDQRKLAEPLMIDAETPDTDAKEETIGVTAAELYTQKLYKDMVSELIEEPIDLTTKDTIDAEPKPWLKPISEMSLEEIEAEVERRRQTLIDEFGNTPEVALINKYTTVETLRDGRTILDTEDSVAYIRAISVLWPTPENIQIFKEFEEMERNGWHANFQGIRGIE